MIPTTKARKILIAANFWPLTLLVMSLLIGLTFCYVFTDYPKIQALGLVIEGILATKAMISLVRNIHPIT